MSDRIPLKFENTAEIGDMIKAFDFQPIPDHPEYPDRYVVGIVTAKGIVEPEGYRAFTILVTEDSCSDGRIGADVFVPFQVSPLDYDGRVTRLKTAELIEHEKQIARETREDFAQA